MTKPLHISFYTLGCKLNQAETAALGNEAEKNGYTIVPFEEPADVTVINSCTLTNRADRKTRQALYQAKRLSPDGILVLAGCFPQINPGKSAEIEGVDIVLGTRDKFDLFAAIDDFRREGLQEVRVSPVNNRDRIASSFIAATDRTRAFLKIQEGCSNFCTYCIVPYARGNPVSREFGNTVSEAKRLAAAGYKEIVLSGIDIGAYQDQGKRLIDVARALETIDGLERIRISSIEMNTLSDELIRHAAASEKIMPHFHLSLQSGSDTILKAMNRKYLTADFTQKMETIRKYIPDASIGTDVIVGFPGENDALFREALDYISDMEFSYLHVFRFSARHGTPAATLPKQVPEAGRKARAAILEDTDRNLRQTYASRFFGTAQPVLWERCEEGLCYGLTPHYLHVSAPGEPAWRNTISTLVLQADHLPSENG
ncbi:MAG: tRNA (N(6)-L-threonylcarbamoyladenosine(37)-C(2))-methylthiotransferase MtaB [Candidatus Marinimicrobia bacterium]|nr:tRNA (N(6)-L-threonylcarbamoyladenosine(37)-C(2))-methylthiotransferase MtaB [Candidatus Neomarinimicrobiota bacterium]